MQDPEQLSSSPERSLEQFRPEIVAWYWNIQKMVKQNDISLIVVSGKSAIISELIASKLLPGITIINIPPGLNKQIQQLGLSPDIDFDKIHKELLDDFLILFDEHQQILFMDDHAQNFSKTFLYANSLVELGILSNSNQRCSFLPLFHPAVDAEKFEHSVLAIDYTLNPELGGEFSPSGRLAANRTWYNDTLTNPEYFAVTLNSMHELVDSVRETDNETEAVKLVEESMLYKYAELAANMTVSPSESFLREDAIA